MFAFPVEGTDQHTQTTATMYARVVKVYVEAEESTATVSSYEYDTIFLADEQGYNYYASHDKWVDPEVIKQPNYARLIKYKEKKQHPRYPVLVFLALYKFSLSIRGPPNTVDI